MSLHRKLVTSLVLFLLSISTASAWDDQRQGFVLGIGVGSGNLEYTDVQSTNLNDSKRSDKLGALAILPKIGYAFTENFALLYFRHPFNIKVEDSQGKTQELTACVEQIGFNYYLSDSTPSLYIGAGTGNSFFFEGSDNYSDGALNGSGSFYSIGYEFATHYSVELTSMKGTLDDNQGSFKGFAVTLNILGY